MDPFFTLMDSRAKLKGSRDPLGSEVIWSAFGRKIISNLTTVTSTPENFATGLLGHYMVQKYVIGADKEEALLCDGFLRFEQLAGYARYTDFFLYKGSDPRIIGIQRLKKKFDQSNTLRLGAGAAYQILAMQKVYGIWGLYTTALRNTGFMVHGSHMLTREGEEVVEKGFLPLITSYKAGIGALIRKDGAVLNWNKSQELLVGLAQALNARSRVLKEKLYLPLILGTVSGEQTMQSGLYNCLVETKVRQLDGMALVDKLIELTGQNPSLNEKLADIRKIEPILSFLQRVFDYMLTQHDEKAAKVASTIRNKNYGLAYLSKNMDDRIILAVKDAAGITVGDIMKRTVDAASGGDIPDMITGLIELNAEVMSRRGGDAWLRIEQGRFKVKYKYEKAYLPERAELASLWSNTYFLHSLVNLVNFIQQD